MKKLLLLLAIATISLSAQSVPALIQHGDNVKTTSLPQINVWFTYLDAKQLKGSGAPSSACDATHSLGYTYSRIDPIAIGSSLYLCHQKVDTTYGWELTGGGGSGTVTSIVIAGTTNQINVTGTCTITTTGTCTITLPNNVVLPGTIDGLTITTTTGTITIANAKTFTVNNSLTLVGTDGVTITFPTTSATMARTDAGQTFTGVQTFASPPVMSAASVTAASLPHSAVASTAVTPGSYTSANITVAADGSITAAANGSSGGFTASQFPLCLQPWGCTNNAATVTAAAHVTYFTKSYIPAPGIIINKIGVNASAGTGTYIVAGFYDATCTTLLGATTPATISTVAYNQLPFASPLTLAAGTVVYFAWTSDGTGAIFTGPSINAGQYFNTGESASTYFTFTGNVSTGTAGTLALPSSCGTRTENDSLLVPALSMH